MILQYGNFGSIGYMESDIIVFAELNMDEALKEFKEYLEDNRETQEKIEYVTENQYLLGKIQKWFTEKISSLDFISCTEALGGKANVAVLIDKTDKGKKAVAFAFSDTFPVYLLNSNGKTIKRIS